MLTRTKRVLSDGTRIEDLVDRPNREVSLSVMNDAELYQIEMEKVFGKTWLLLGHDTEIPNSGDYVVRHMGEDAVIVTRASDGQIYVSLNVCPHRGMHVCTAESGNAQVHRCIYHGWAFRADGSFIGAPVERERMHGDLKSKEQLGLKKARVALYGGLIFANWDVDAPSLEESLGDMKFYYDMLFKRTDNGLEVLGPPQRLTIDANWKTAGEQSACDGFHTLTLHRSLLERGIMGGSGGDEVAEFAPGMYGINVGENGNTLRCIPVNTTFTLMLGESMENLSVDERFEKLPPPGIMPSMLPEMKRNMTPEQLHVMSVAPPQVGNLFPNVNILFIYAPLRDGTMGSGLLLHTIVPKGVEKFQWLTWFFAEKDTPDDVKKLMRAAASQAGGTSGMIEQDDSDTWPHMTESARGFMGRQETLKYQAILGENRPDDWPDKAKVYNGFSKDDAQWLWWEQYFALMTN
ncbi:MAG: Aromatic ring-hydroxylating dioxygenase subunit alpha [Verrucomicrobiaceae bacterium]|nr:Aromatic ring-hydroxylating dioxygenase subunit alpha [Verrucomicrobiaceae bacterium]